MICIAWHLKCAFSPTSATPGGSLNHNHPAEDKVEEEQWVNGQECLVLSQPRPPEKVHRCCVHKGQAVVENCQRLRFPTLATWIPSIRFSAPIAAERKETQSTHPTHTNPTPPD